MAHMRVLQLVPALRCGGVERGTVEIDAALGPSRSLVASSGGPLTNLLCGLHLHWPTLRWRDPLSVLLINPLLLWLAVRRHGINIVHARSRCLALSARIALAFAPGVRLVATWHGFHTATSWWRRAFNGLLLGADRLILPSECVRRHVARLYPRAPTDGWTVVPRGAAPEHFAPPPPSSSSPTSPTSPPPVALLLGRVSRSKGQDLFVAALARLRADGVAVDGRIVGVDASKRPGRYHRALAASAAAAGSVRLLPLVGAADVGAAYAAAAVVVMPSRRPEAFGRVLLEAVAARRLVVAYHHGAAGEVAAALWRHAGGGPMRRVRPGVVLVGSVYLVAPLDVGALAAAIGDALRMENGEREERTGRAQAAAKACYPAEAFAAAVLETYREVGGGG